MYVYFFNSVVVGVTNMITGVTTNFYSNDSRYEKAKELIRVKDYAGVEALSARNAVEKIVKASLNFPDTSKVANITIRDNVGYIQFKFCDEIAIPDVLVKRLMQCVNDGFDVQPMVNFITNLYMNPSSTAVNELFLFLESTQLPITDDGHFIAYKIVGDNYKDLYSGNFDNSVGQTPSMPRNQVDDNRSNTCSRGLHFCSRGYLPHYGKSKGSRCIIVKINPADVVSIPNDYNNAKGRCWQYEVVGEVKGDWRNDLSDKDYNSKSVVSQSGDEYDENSDIISLYLDGYNDGRKKNPVRCTNLSYSEGYKDGKNKKKKRYS